MSESKCSPPVQFQRMADTVRFCPIVQLVIVLCCTLTLVRAENVDLSTIPVRDSVQLTVYNSEDITLVRETRTVTFKKGHNPLQFSWANTMIDPSSVELEFMTHGEQLEVMDTTFPHSKPQVLFWNIQSEFAGEAMIQITYFTSGITWSADYLCIANRDEETLNLEGFVRVSNQSGEEYENAQIRLVVGTINLVEKIAQLANISTEEVEELSEVRLKSLRTQATRNLFFLGDLDNKSGDRFDHLAESAEKQIIKEGLSEYFIYAIEGTETIPNGWSKRLRSFAGDEATFQIEYRYRPQEYGDQLVRIYSLKNDKASRLGTTPLPDGVVRVFRDNGRDGLTFLVQQSIKYVPIGDKIELNLGPDPEVQFELRKLKANRENLWVQIHGQNQFRKIGDAVLKVEENSSVVGWDEHEYYSQRIRNYSGKDIDVEIRRSWPGHIVFRSLLAPTLHDYQTVQIKSQVPSGATADLLFKVVRHQGKNAKQSNVKLERRET